MTSDSFDQNFALTLSGESHVDLDYIYCTLCTIRNATFTLMSIHLWSLILIMSQYMNIAC
jgi:hypothetical protein